MGVRQGEKDFQNTLDSWIDGHQAEIAQILTEYHIPLLEESPSPHGRGRRGRQELVKALERKAGLMVAARDPSCVHPRLEIRLVGPVFTQLGSHLEGLHRRISL